MKNLQNDVGEKLKKADFLILTFGTAFVYQLLETKSYVANCHKMPANLFRKDLIHVKHICQEFEHFYKKIKEQMEIIENDHALIKQDYNTYLSSLPINGKH